MTKSVHEASPVRWDDLTGEFWAYCSCGWEKGCDDYDVACEAWEDHCDVVFMEATMAAEPWSE